MSRTTFLPRLAGEFLVIVVGVLVALFVDGLREDRRERGYERQVLDAVAADLRANLEDLAQAERGACPYLAAFSLSADAYRAPAATRRVFASAEEIMVMERNMAVALDQTARADEAARSALGRLQDHQRVGSGRLVQR
jgi:hypothetical protein